MISNLLAQLTMLKNEVPDDEWEPDVAIETVVESADQEVSETEEQEMREWLEAQE